MSTRKTKGYYQLDNLLEVNAQYNILIGERSNGKSYAVKHHCIEEAINHGKEFMLLRRLEKEVKGFWAQSYFDDVDIKNLKISNDNKKKYDCINVYANAIYLAHIEEDTTGKEKIVRDKRIGRVMALSRAGQYKSMTAENVDNIIFEEFITNEGYLSQEADRLMQYVSTVARRRDVHVYMIGNTISRLCPYFDEWQLTHIPQQKQGTIDIYNMESTEKNEDGTPLIVKVAVELTSHATHSTSKMFFGTRSKAIINGVWESAEQPHLTDDYENFDCLYSVCFIVANMKYTAELLKHKPNQWETEAYSVIYVRPTGKKITSRRIIQNEYSTNPLITDRFYVLTKGDEKMKKLFQLNKVVYSDNLTGSEFKDVIKVYVNGLTLKR